MSKAIVVLFGVVGYLVCLGTFLCAIGYVGNTLMLRSGTAELWSRWFLDRSDSHDRRGLPQRDGSIGFQEVDKSNRASDRANRVCIVREACIRTPLDDGDCMEC